MAALLKFAKERGFEGELMPWDIPYWKRKQQRTIFKLVLIILLLINLFIYFIQNGRG